MLAQDEVLRRAVFKHGGKKWKTIATFFQQKTPSQCNQRWNELQNHGSAVKKPWCPNEDMRMIDLVKTHGPGKWAVIASYLPGRNGKQCRERWHNQLNPAIKKGPWTAEEDQIIMEMQAKHGNRWAKITEKLPGRTDNAVKNHWHSSMKAKVKRFDTTSVSSGGATTVLITFEPSSSIVSVKDESDEPAVLPVTPTFVEYADVKLEPGSLSPDSVAMCPSQLDPALRADHSVFLLEDAFVHDDEAYFALPQCADHGGDSEGEGEADIGSVFDGLDDEELVLSTDLSFDAASIDTDLTAAEDIDTDTDDPGFGDSDSAFDESDSDGSGFDADAFEPCLHDCDSISSLELAGDEDLHADLLEILRVVAIDDPVRREYESPMPKTERLDSPQPAPTTGLFLSDWNDASSLRLGGLALSPYPNTVDHDPTTYGALLASLASSSEGPMAPPPFVVPLPLTDAALCAWPNVVVATSTPPQPPPPSRDEADDAQFVWDLL